MREVIHTINGATATTTGAAIPLDNATGVSFQFQRSDHSSGKTVFTVNLSNDGTTYTQCNMLIDNIVADAGAGTSGEDIGHTRVNEYDTGAANVTKVYILDPVAARSFKYLTVTATETTDGTHDAWVCIQRDE